MACLCYEKVTVFLIRLNVIVFVRATLGSDAMNAFTASPVEVGVKPDAHLKFPPVNASVAVIGEPVLLIFRDAYGRGRIIPAASDMNGLLGPNLTVTVVIPFAPVNLNARKFCTIGEPNARNDFDAPPYVELVGKPSAGTGVAPLIAVHGPNNPGAPAMIAVCTGGKTVTPCWTHIKPKPDGKLMFLSELKKPMSMTGVAIRRSPVLSRWWRSECWR